jgi:aspartate/methionine/tyrosine aminotransferase
MNRPAREFARFQPSSRLSAVEPFRAFEIVARTTELTRQGRDIISMAVGQPYAPAPSSARMAAAEAIANRPIGYTQAPGMDELRLRISGHCKDRYGLEPDPARIFVTTGSSAGFVLAFLCSFDVGARVAIPSPGYPAYRNILRALSLEPVLIETSSADRWVVTAEALSAANDAERLDGVLVANPNNPNGTMMGPDAFAALVNMARELDIRFISDEIYHGLTYGMPETTALALDDEAIVINSFSKYFCMTGWRIGWMIVPDAMIAAVNKAKQNIYICAPEISQIAAIAAFDGIDELEAVKAGYLENRNLFLQRLPQMGFGAIQPIDGAFYAYCDVSRFTDDSLEFASRMLEEAGVAATPGPDFDPARGNSWLRLSFCGDRQTLERGLDRIEAWLS